MRAVWLVRYGGARSRWSSSTDPSSLWNTGAPPSIETENRSCVSR